MLSSIAIEVVTPVIDLAETEGVESLLDLFFFQVVHALPLVLHFPLVDWPHEFLTRAKLEEIEVGYFHMGEKEVRVGHFLSQILSLVVRVDDQQNLTAVIALLLEKGGLVSSRFEWEN